MALDRRRFLELAGVSAIVPLIAASRAQSGDAKTPPAAARKPILAVELAGAWNAARRARRPLLVMLEGGGLRDSRRGWQWSAFGRGAPLTTDADLKKCDLAFASAAHVKEVWPAIVLDEKTLPFGIVVSADESYRRIEPAGEPPLYLDDDPEKRAEFDAWCIAVAKAIHVAVVPTDAPRTSPTDSKLVLDTRSTAPSPLDLASRARDVFEGSAPPGARWARLHGGCGGIELDSGEQIASAGPCGTAAMSREARRFFWLYLRPKPA